MVELLYFLMWSLGAILFFFSIYQFSFMLVSTYFWLFINKKNSEAASQKDTKFGIIIPAHNEEILIGGLVNSIKECNYPQENVHIYVIADNCDDEDETAEIASSLGADVRIRKNEELRGKPYALDWLISSIDLDQHDAYVIIDADTTIDVDFLSEMERTLNKGYDVIQGYFGVMNPDENWLTRLSILPGVVKFLLHFPGKVLLNLTCPLAGNGMCFRNEIFKKYGWSAYSVAENWEYYVQLTLKGHRVTSAHNAIIYSQVAKSLKTGTDQRQRWQKGRMETLKGYWKELLSNTFKNFDLSQLDALIEVARPSHAILLFSSVIFSLLTVLVYFLEPEQWSLLLFSCIIVGLQVVYFLTGLIVQKAPLSTWISLLMVPPYLGWKVLISLKGLLSKKERKWIKTERH